MKSSAAGTDLSWARLRRFMIMVETLVMHLTLSSGILKAASLLSSAYIKMIKKINQNNIIPEQQARDTRTDISGVS